MPPEEMWRWLEKRGGEVAEKRIGGSCVAVMAGTITI
jgi:hypothetical protein